MKKLAAIGLGLVSMLGISPAQAGRVLYAFGGTDGTTAIAVSDGFVAAADVDAFGYKYTDLSTSFCRSDAMACSALRLYNFRADGSRTGIEVLNAFVTAVDAAALVLPFNTPGTFTKKYAPTSYDQLATYELNDDDVVYAFTSTLGMVAVAIAPGYAVANQESLYDTTYADLPTVLCLGGGAPCSSLRLSELGAATRTPFTAAEVRNAAGDLIDSAVLPSSPWNVPGTTSQQARGILYNFSIIGPITTVAAVPEPATWAMMIAGFGMIGGRMRRRRRHTSVRFA